MPCHCNTATLRFFLRSFVQIDSRPTAHHATPSPFVPSRHRLSTFQPQSLRQTLSTGESVDVLRVECHVNKDSTLLPPSSSLDSPSSTRLEKWPSPSKAFDSHIGLIRPSTHAYDNRPGAILDINPDTIDALAFEFQREKVHPTSITPQTGLALRHSSPMATLTAKTDEKRTPIRKSRDVVREHSQREYDNEEQLYPRAKREPWQAQKAALKEKFQDGWSPRKRLSPDALAGIRAIHAQFPEQYTSSVLAEKFQVSPESIRRILKSNWTPKEEEELDRQRRWFNRGQKVWVRYAELGLRPPNKWRALGIGKKGNRG